MLRTESSPEAPFHVTPEARAELQRRLRTFKDGDRVLTLVKGRDGGSGEVKWGVGIYERANLGDDARVQQVYDLPFYIDPSVEAQVRGAVLHCENGKLSLKLKSA